jgi:hypothetical protein
VIQSIPQQTSYSGKGDNTQKGKIICKSREKRELECVAIKPIMQSHGCFHPSPAAGIHPAMENKGRSSEN